MCESRWSPAKRSERCSSQKRVSEGLWPGRCRTVRVRSRSCSCLPRGERAVHLDRAPPRAKARRDGPQGGDYVGGDPVAEHDARREAVIELGVGAEVAQAVVEALQGGDLRTGAPREDRREAEVVDVLVGDDQQLQVLDRVPPRRERLFELVERLRGVRPRVDQRERLVLNQVRVDASDRERRGDRQAVDALLRGALQGGGLVDRVPLGCFRAGPGTAFRAGRAAGRLSGGLGWLGGGCGRPRGGCWLRVGFGWLSGGLGWLGGGCGRPRGGCWLRVGFGWLSGGLGWLGGGCGRPRGGCWLRLELCRLARAHERISPSTSSRRRSMSSCERSDSRQRRSSGSVLEGRTLKCHCS